MNKTIDYNNTTGVAIQAMMESACKDEYIDKKMEFNLSKKKKKKKDVTLKDIREWNKKRVYQGDIQITVDAMMASALNDPYTDKNPPARF